MAAQSESAHMTRQPVLSLGFWLSLSAILLLEFSLRLWLSSVNAVLEPAPTPGLEGLGLTFFLASSGWAVDCFDKCDSDFYARTGAAMLQLLPASALAWLTLREGPGASSLIPIASGMLCGSLLSKGLATLIFADRLVPRLLLPGIWPVSLPASMADSALFVPLLILVILGLGYSGRRS